MNPCPCGWSGSGVRPCRCPAAIAARYRARVSGPLLDRFDLRHRLADVRARLATLESRLGRATTGAQHTARRRFHEAAARLEALSPLSVLGRGYAVCWNEDRTAVLRDATTVSLGHQVHVRLARGTINCTVTGRNE
ncbi:MAG: hypothetical protein HOP14_08860, partial [Acidobacteria bacterium]|nr:hypothetical protein [Acidobacteriota bacterium]